MKNLHIENSYSTWSIPCMLYAITLEANLTYDSIEPEKLLNRSLTGMYIEWYLHNIGYLLTLPFIKNTKIARLNERFKHLDLEEHP